jgi:hypothetical protein
LAFGIQPLAFAFLVFDEPRIRRTPRFIFRKGSRRKGMEVERGTEDAEFSNTIPAGLMDTDFF